MSLRDSLGGGRTRPNRSAIKIKPYSFVIPALLGGHQADPRKNRIRRRLLRDERQLQVTDDVGVGVEPVVADLGQSRIV